MNFIEILNISYQHVNESSNGLITLVADNYLFIYKNYLL